MSGEKEMHTPVLKGELWANALQIARINAKLPREFRFETLENVRKIELEGPAIGKRKKVAIKNSEIVTGREYEEIFADESGAGHSPSPSGEQDIEGSTRRKRHSAREKRPVHHDDLGYIDPDQNRRQSKSFIQYYYYN